MKQNISLQFHPGGIRTNLTELWLIFNLQLYKLKATHRLQPKPRMVTTKFTIKPVQVKPATNVEKMAGKTWENLEILEGIKLLIGNNKKFLTYENREYIWKCQHAFKLNFNFCKLTLCYSVEF